MTWLGRSIALILLLGASAASAQPSDDPFARLRDAYAARDAEAAAAAYADDAVYAELYPESPPNLLAGREAIRRNFAAFFAALPADGPVDLNFRLLRRTASEASGYYRLRFGSGDAATVHYGRFVTGMADGRFRFDASSTATLAEFEGAAGPTALAADDELLDPAYYGALAGRWVTPAGCRLTVTRSARRLYLLDSCGDSWRGLNRMSGREWTAGSRVIDGTAVSRRLRFGPDGTLDVDGVAAQPDPAWRREPISFAGPAGRLAGTLYLPATPGTPRRAAIVLVHGSGPQDRDGYASIIALMAAQFADAGLIVLTYDKRGVGASQGSWEGAGFDALAADATAAMAALRARGDVDPARVGLGGSSQAGWVAARAVADGADSAFVILVGAAGTAMTVEEQNLYNTRVRMRCSGIAERDIALALDQQRAFFAARRDAALAPVLAAISRRAALRPALADWLFPADATPSASPQWYDVLDPDFDPLPVWRAYRGELFMLFGENDDSTPTAVATRRLRAIGTSVVLGGAQHLGLSADGLCSGELDRVDRFAPAFWPTLRGWAETVGSRR